MPSLCQPGRKLGGSHEEEARVRKLGSWEEEAGKRKVEEGVGEERATPDTR